VAGYIENGSEVALVRYTKTLVMGRNKLYDPASLYVCKIGVFLEKLIIAYLIKTFFTHTFTQDRFNIFVHMRLCLKSVLFQYY
jgi:hypothetical protein